MAAIGVPSALFHPLKVRFMVSPAVKTNDVLKDILAFEPELYVAVISGLKEKVP
jgi:hypothetical protein